MKKRLFLYCFLGCNFLFGSQNIQINSVIDNLYKQVSKNNIPKNSKLIKKIQNMGKKEHKYFTDLMQKNRKKTNFHYVNKNILYNIEKGCKNQTKNKNEYQKCINLKFRKIIDNQRKKDNIENIERKKNNIITNKKQIKNTNNTKIKKKEKYKIINITNPYINLYLKNEIKKEREIRNNFFKKDNDF